MKSIIVCLFFLVLTLSVGQTRADVIDYADNIWPIHKVSSDKCSQTDMFYWRKKADEIVSLAPIEFYNTHPKLRMMEEGVVKNALINLAYARLFIDHVNTSETKMFYWLGSATFGSLATGEELRTALYYKVKKGHYQNQIHFKTLMNTKENVQGLASLLLRFKDMSFYLAKSNSAIYEDIFWQFLAAHSCGAGKVVSLMDEAMNQYKHRKEVKDHYLRMKEGWELLSNPTSSPEDILKGNVIFLKDEQLYTLQPLMYDVWQSKAVSLTRVFNKYATAMIDGLDESVLSFDEYTELHDLNNNLSLFNERMQWVTYLVGEHKKFFDKKMSEKQIQSVFNPVLGDSYIILKDYMRP